MGFSTDCVHAGQEPEAVTGAVTYPIFATSTYVQPKFGEHKGFEYARTKNPTRSVLEANLAALERGKHGHCFASGMAARIGCSAECSRNSDCSSRTSIHRASMPFAQRCGRPQKFCFSRRRRIR